MNKAKWKRRVLYAWLWRSQPDSPYYDPEKAERIYCRYQVTVETELVHAGLELKVERCCLEELEKCVADNVEQSFTPKVPTG